METIVKPELKNDSVRERSSAHTYLLFVLARTLEELD